MQDAQQWIVDVLKTRTLPEDVSPFLDLIKNRELGIFETQENTYWDYKDQFPHSMTDDYFWGISKLICGFHNRFGGLIIFGVHDEKRTAGHNKVHVDIERLNTRLREVLNIPIECIHRRYRFGSGKPILANRHEDDAFDILLIPKRVFSKPVVRFRSDVGKYKSSDIFVRQNHEVVRANSSDITELYTPRSGYGLLQEDTDSPIPSMLPQRPSVLREFIGRTRVLDQLFTWFVTKDEMRTFLHGRGGSGKSTVAFEFASIISRHGGDIEIQGGSKVDRVIYLSAKEQELDTTTRKIRKFLGKDFSSADELFRDILFLCEWSSSEKIDALTSDELRDELRQLFDLQSLLIIIDDIDTLYTKGIDEGSEFLITALARAKQRSKIIYTMRQRPSLSIAAAIEVAGLEIGEEYNSFIEICSAQFQVPPPKKELVDGRLREISEGIPLILETIIALRKISSSYEDAIAEFLSVGGSDVRRYLFSREYGTLHNNQAKLVLAALALFDNPASFEELQYALKFDKTIIYDALGAISEMFLNRVPQDDETTRFTVGEVTREFVIQESTKLDQFDLLKSRIANFQKPFSGKNKGLILMTERVETFLSRNDYSQALAAVDAVNDAAILEHRDFKILAVRVYSDQRVSRSDDARRLYNDLFAMKVRNPKLYREWIAMERQTDTSFHNMCDVCNKVLAADWIKEEDKLYFHFTKAGAQYNRGRQLLSLNEVGSIECLIDAMNHHLIVFSKKGDLARDYFARSEEYCINTMHNLIQASRRFGLEKDLFGYVDKVFARKDGVVVDPIAIPLGDYVRAMPERASKSELDRVFFDLSRLDGIVQRGLLLFKNKKYADDLKSAIAVKRKTINDSLKKKALN